MSSLYNEFIPCGPFVFTTDIAVWRDDFLHVKAIATYGGKCTWLDLNTVVNRNCSSFRLQLLITDRNDTMNFTVFNFNCR